MKNNNIQDTIRKAEYFVNQGDLPDLIEATKLTSGVSNDEKNREALKNKINDKLTKCQESIGHWLKLNENDIRPYLPETFSQFNGLMDYLNFEKIIELDSRYSSLLLSLWHVSEGYITTNGFITRCLPFENQLYEGLTKKQIKEIETDYLNLGIPYLFCWDQIPGKDGRRLIEFLKQNFDIYWAKIENIEKINEGRTINVFSETKSISLKLNVKKTTVNLILDDGRTYLFDAKMEIGRLNIYDKSSLIRAVRTTHEILKNDPTHAEALKIKDRISEKLTEYQNNLRNWLLENEYEIRRILKIYRFYEKYDMDTQVDAFSKLLDLVDYLDFDKSIKLDDRQTLLLVLLKEVSNKGITKEKFISEYYKIAKKLATDAGEWNSKGLELGNLKKYDEAIDRFEKALSLDPHYVVAWRNKGFALYNLGKYNEAIQCYDKAIKTNKNFARAYYSKGNALFELGKYDEAIECFGETTRIYPNYLEAWHNKGYALLDLGKYDEAIWCFDKALDINPNYARAWLSRGDVLFKIKNYNEAIKCYDRAIDAKPDYVNAWYSRGNALHRLRNYYEAIKCYDKAVEIDPSIEEDPNIWYSKANTLFDLEKYSEAIKYYDKAIEIDSYYTWAWINKGNALYDLKIYAEAIKCYNEAIKVNPYYAEAWYGSGNALYNLKDYNEAIKCYDKAAEIDPGVEKNPNIWYSKGNALYNLRNYDKAIKCFDKAIEINSNYIDAWYSKANAFFDLKKYNEALDYYDITIKINPNNIRAWYNKGNVLYNLRNYDEAVRCFDQAIEIDNSYAWAWINKGNALFDLGKYDEAVKCYEDVIKINPNYTWIWSGEGSAIDNLGKYDQALKYYDTIIKINPDYAWAWYSKGNALYNLRDYDKAIKCYDRAIEIDSNYVWAWYGKGDVLDNLRNCDEAIKCYKEAVRCCEETIKINSNDAWAWYSKGITLQKLKHYDEAIECSDKAIELNPDDQNFPYPWILKGDNLRAIGNYIEAEHCYNEALNFDSKNTSVLNRLSLLYSEYMYDYDKALQLAHLILEINPDSFLAKDKLAENLIKTGRYRDGRKLALQALNETQNTAHQHITKFLIVSSYFLEDDVANGSKELTKFLEDHKNLSEPFKVEKEMFSFRGLTKVITNANIGLQAKFILLTLIDLILGKIDRQNLSFFQTCSLTV